MAGEDPTLINAAGFRANDSRTRMASKCVSPGIPGIFLHVCREGREETQSLDRQVVTRLSSRMTDVLEAIVAHARRAILDGLTERNGHTLFEICARLIVQRQVFLHSRRTDV